MEIVRWDSGATDGRFGTVPGGIVDSFGRIGEVKQE